jgi:hypothetical protein
VVALGWTGCRECDHSRSQLNYSRQGRTTCEATRVTCSCAGSLLCLCKATHQQPRPVAHPQALPVTRRRVAAETAPRGECCPSAHCGCCAAIGAPPSSQQQHQQQGQHQHQQGQQHQQEEHGAQPPAQWLPHHQQAWSWWVVVSVLRLCVQCPSGAMCACRSRPAAAAVCARLKHTHGRPTCASSLAQTT